MTTIAWDGETLASDSRVTQDSHLVSDSFQKIFTIEGAEYRGDRILAVAMSGKCCDYHKILDYIFDENFGYTNFGHDTNCILIGKKFAYDLARNDGYLVKFNKKAKIANGSGGCFALSAMTLGLSAPEAVKHAKKLDCASGGRVQIWRES